MTNHNDILSTYAVVSVATACAIIGGDGAPVSEGTIYRLIRAGLLSRAGKGKITTASIRAYLEQGPCHVAADGKKAPAVSTKPPTAGARSVSAPPLTASDAMNDASLPPRLKLVPRLPRGRAKP